VLYFPISSFQYLTLNGPPTSCVSGTVPTHSSSFPQAFFPDPSPWPLSPDPRTRPLFRTDPTTFLAPLSVALTGLPDRETLSPSSFASFFQSLHQRASPPRRPPRFPPPLLPQTPHLVLFESFFVTENFLTDAGDSLSVLPLFPPFEFGFDKKGLGRVPIALRGRFPPDSFLKRASPSLPEMFRHLLTASTGPFTFSEVSPVDGDLFLTIQWPFFFFFFVGGGCSPISSPCLFPFARSESRRFLIGGLPLFQPFPPWGEKF